MDTSKDAYWKANIRLVTGCLIVWFIVSFGFGILLVDFFNHFRIGGYPLGFWFAQQGSIFAFGLAASSLFPVILMGIFNIGYSNHTTE